MSRTPLLLIPFLLVASFATLAAPYRSNRLDYTITLPDNWTQVPDKVLATFAEAARSSDLRAPIPVWDAAFQPTASTPHWFTYPYVTIQIIPYSTFGLNRQIREDEFAQVTKAMTGVDVAKVLDKAVSADARNLLSNATVGEPQLDKARHRFFYPVQLKVAGVGNVKGMMCGYFGRAVILQIGFYTRLNDWDRYGDTSASIIDSVRFDPTAAYDPSLSRSFWSTVGEKTAIGGIAGALVGLVSYTVAKKKKTTTSPTPTPAESDR